MCTQQLAWSCLSVEFGHDERSHSLKTTALGSTTHQMRYQYEYSNRKIKCTWQKIQNYETCKTSFWRTSSIEEYNLQKLRGFQISEAFLNNIASCVPGLGHCLCPLSYCTHSQSCETFSEVLLDPY